MVLSERLISAILFATAGGCAFLILLNRVLLPFRDHPLKSIMILVVACGMTGGVSGFGFFTGFSVWLVVPIITLIGVMMGEVHRSRLRLRAKGVPPDETLNARIAVTRPLTSTDLVITRYTIPFSNWHGPPFRIAHLSDLHISAHYSAQYYHDVLRHVAEAHPDMIVFTGDFVTTADDIPLLPQWLPSLNSIAPTFAVLGNHDYWAGADEVAAAVQEAGITLLRHTCRTFQGAGGQSLYLCGDEAPWGQSHLADHDADMLRIVLTHTPDNIYRLNAAGAQAVFAGHYHAGQFRIPYLGSVVVPSAYGRRFDHGHFLVNGTHLFVTSGLGTTVAPIRIYCQPDLFLVDVVGGNQTSR